jgi:general stress protein YciG
MANDKKGTTSYYSKKPMSKEELAKKGGFRSVATFDKHRERPADYGKHPYKLDTDNK